MAADLVQLVDDAGPYITAALGAYGRAVLTQAENAAAGATANLGRRILQLVWHRRAETDQGSLQAALEDATQDCGDPDAAAALRYQIRRALRDDADLLGAFADLLPTPVSNINITASGDRSIAAHTIATAITGDGHRPSV
ncbi:hypothetical protein GCM10010193_39690 [Kitasatospora atroaurantiaca]